jgi:SAM-dependent methyltransferase
MMRGRARSGGARGDQVDRSRSIQRQFGASAERYASSGYHAASADLAALLEAAQLRGDECVLDVGTGAGHTALAVAPGAGRVIGLDLTLEMLREARRLAAERGAANLWAAGGDAAVLPFADARFDLVTCRVCAHHFADPGAAVREMARVLRPGGRLLLVDSVAPEDPAQDTFLNCIELLRDPSHVRDHTERQWCVMFEAAGLEVRRLGRWGAFLPFGDWVERMRTPEPTRRELRRLLGGATLAIREAFGIREDPEPGFEMPIVLLRGEKGREPQ